jgi:ribosomal protein S18 acetylase RimI-like enzyme
MLIRPATIDDIPYVLPMVAKICALHQAWDNAKYNFLPNPERIYQPWLTDHVKNPKSVFLVAESDTTTSLSHLIAFLIATTEREIPIYRLKEYGFIHDLWVEPEYRHIGVARLLVKRAIAQFTQMEIKQIRLDVAAANEVAKRLFTTCGFREGITEMLIELSN